MDFDVNAFLDDSTDQQAQARPPIDAREYISTIRDIEFKEWQSKEKINPRTGELYEGVNCNIAHTLDVPADIAEKCGLETPTLQLIHRVSVDRKGNALDWSRGKNNGLRAYRDATDLNVAGQTFNPRMLIGRTVRVRVGHEIFNDRPVEKIVGVARA